MKICVDENIPLRTVRHLRVIGHDVLDIRGTVDEGMTEVLRLFSPAQWPGLLVVMRDEVMSSRRQGKGR